MANPNRPQGFRPYGEVRQIRYFNAGGTFYKGDMVKLNSSGQVVVCAAGDAMLGCSLANASSGDARVPVSVDPEQLYIAQCHGSAVDAQTDIGNVADILATSGDSTYKVSRQEIDDSTLATSSAGLLIVEILPKPSNAGGANAEAIVKINEHQAFGKDSFAGV